MLLLINGSSGRTMLQSSFNTSHVTINPGSAAEVKMKVFGFNTSHVTINPAGKIDFVIAFRRFNTSHVTINQKLYCICG